VTPWIGPDLSTAGVYISDREHHREFACLSFLTRTLSKTVSPTFRS
jgi:hypothetical protein